MKKRLKTILVLVTAAISFAAIITVSGCAAPCDCKHRHGPKLTPAYGEPAHEL